MSQECSKALDHGQNQKADDNNTVTPTRSEKHHLLLTEYSAIDPRSITHEMETLQTIGQALTIDWESEVQQYEQSQKVFWKNGWYEVPHRNYFNEDGIVQHEALFPYHTSCYPLIDAYDCFYEYKEQEPLQDENSIRHERIPPLSRRVVSTLFALDEETEVEGYLPNSELALQMTFPTVVSPNLISSKDEEEEQEENEEEVKASATPHMIPQPNSTKTRTQSNQGTSIWKDLNAYRQNPNHWYDRTIQKWSSKLHDPGTKNKYGTMNFPSNREQRTTLLLKLLKHSMSELQKDYRLAKVIVLQLLQFHDIDDLDTFRKLLLILGTEYKNCIGTCHFHFWNQHQDINNPPPDHSCREWIEFSQRTVPRLFAKGITYITSEHASSIAALVRLSYQIGNTVSLLDYYDDDGNGGDGNGFECHENEPLTSRQRKRLKRNLYILQNMESLDDDDYDDENNINNNNNNYNSNQRNKDGEPNAMIHDIVLGIGAHAVQDRKNLKQLQQVLDKYKDKDADKASINDLFGLIQLSMDSYYNGIRTLVDIGEASFERLVAKGRSISLCSAIVKALLVAHLDSYQYDMVMNRTSRYIGLEREDFDTVRLLSCNRYADTVTHATARVLGRLQTLKRCRIKSQEHSLHTSKLLLDRFFAETPSDDVHDVVRHLFIRDMVEVHLAGFGYGDFLVWLGYETHPLDSVLFCGSMNYPTDDEVESGWDIDEEKLPLDSAALKARHDFTLIRLLQAWHAPWAPSRHHSFQPALRKAIFSLALCSRRLNMPKEIAVHVGEFLPRDWWPDERKECWCWDCLIEVALQIHRRKRRQRIQGEQNSNVSCSHKNRVRFLECCPGCGVAIYCGNKHRTYLFKEGHNRVCGIPPFRIPGANEAHLCFEVLGHEASSVAITFDEPMDDDGSWESIDSDAPVDDVTDQSITKVVQRFFEKSAMRQESNTRT